MGSWAGLIEGTLRNHIPVALQAWRVLRSRTSVRLWTWSRFERCVQRWSLTPLHLHRPPVNHAPCSGWKVLLSAMQSKYAVQLLGYSVELPWVNILMERCQGDVKGMMHGPSMLLPQRVRMAEQMAGCVQYMHELRIVHRGTPRIPATHLHSLYFRMPDIKPENFLVTTGGEVKICDLGLARRMALEDDVVRKASIESALPGTPLYMAPEVIKGQPYSRSSDVYSLTVVLFECLAQVHPFEHLRFPCDVMDGVIEGLRPAFPVEFQLQEEPYTQLRAMLEQGWAQDPDDRPSAARIVEVLIACKS